MLRRWFEYLVQWLSVPRVAGGIVHRIENAAEHGCGYFLFRANGYTYEVEIFLNDDGELLCEVTAPPVSHEVERATTELSRDGDKYDRALEVAHCILQVTEGRDYRL